MSYSEAEAKELVITAGKKLVETGLIARTWGNISARISDTEFVITPSGMAYESLTPEKIVKVNMTDCSYEGEIKPSSEKGVHAVAYRLRPSVNFVIHTHQKYASALSILGQDITDFTDCVEADRQLLGGRIPCASYGMSSTEKLTNAVSCVIQKHPDSAAVLMKYHGALCMGTDFTQAFAISHALERVCDKKYYSMVFEPPLGEKPKMILSESLYQSGEYPCIRQVTSPCILQMSRKGKTMHPYLDDLAQIAGTSVRCVDDMNSPAVLKALRNRNAVFIKGSGAICVGQNESDVEAVGLVLEKGCLAALLAETADHVRPVAPIHAYLDRKVYVTSYSHLKEKS